MQPWRTRLLVCRSLLGGDVRGEREIAIFQPIKGYLCVGLFLVAVEIGHEHLETLLWRDAAEAVGELGLVVDEVEIEPWVVGGVDEGEVGVVHGELAEVDGTAVETEEVVPLGEFGLVGVGVAVDEDEIGFGEGDAGGLAADVGRWREFGGVEEDVIAGNLDTGHGRGAHDVFDVEVKATEEGFDGDLEGVDFDDVEVDAAVGCGGDGADYFNGEWHAFVQGAGGFELVAFAGDGDIFEWEASGGGGVEVVSDIAEVGVDDALLDEEDEGFWIVEGGSDIRMGAEHLTAEPADVDAEDGAFAQDKVVRIDGGGFEIVV